ncbi:MAG: MBL fold metallo-hydrolase [Thermodesulfobacteriota bacterium]
MKITETIHALKHHFQIPVSPEMKVDRFVYSYIVFGEEGIHLVDSGVMASEKAIYSYIEGQGRSPAEIKSLFLTHSHPDHVGAARLIQQKSGCQLFAHAGEKDWTEDVQKQYAERPVPGFNTLVAGSARVDRLAADGDIIRLEENIAVKVIYTPGHSAGSISLLFEMEGVLISGDCVLLPGMLPIYDNVLEGAASVKKLQRLVNINVLLSAWDEPRQGAAVREKMNQSVDYLEKIHRTIHAIEDAGKLDRVELCKRVVAILGLPADAINPLVIRSLFLNAQAGG